MTKEFKKISRPTETRYILENITSGGTGSGAIATSSGTVGKFQKRNSILTQETGKEKENSKPRNFVAKNAKMGGAGAHKDKKKAEKQGDIKHKNKSTDLEEDWQKVNKSDKTDGMSKKAVSAYRRENPGSKLKTAVTKKPSELKPGSKDANRRKSFCARMSGVDGPMKDEKGRPTAKAKALNRWNCNESVAEDKDPCWNDYKQIGMKTKNGKKVPNCVPKEDVEEAKFEYTPYGTSLITNPEEYKRWRDQREIESVFGDTPRHIRMARTGMYKKSIATPRQWKMLFDLTDEQGRFLPRMSKGHATGAADKKAGKDINSNPFAPDSAEHRDWVGGWKSVGVEEDNLNEKAPPGMEDVVLKLKKQYPDNPERAFKTAWAIYNKQKTENTDAYTESLKLALERQLEPTMGLNVWQKNFLNANPSRYHQFKNKTPAKKKTMAAAALYKARQPSNKK